MLYHIVLFKFKPETTAEQIKEVNDSFLQLRTKCLKASTNEGYIVSSTGGKDNSVEGRQDGISHAFIVEFANEQDRDYYVEKDPAHHNFVQYAMQYLAKAQVIDFNKGVF